MTVTLGIDLGTQSLKTLVYDASACRVLATAAAPLALDQRDDGSAEQRADWWLDALAAACAQLPADARRAVQAIGVSGQQHGFVPVDERGVALAPVKLWCDTSTAGQCDTLMSALGGNEACIAAAGNPGAAGLHRLQGAVVSAAAPRSV
ncbi:MAG: FGGY family carbohydrate kinase [Pseudomonadota bacterium]